MDNPQLQKQIHANRAWHVCILERFLSATSVKLTNVLTSKVTRLSLDSDFFYNPYLQPRLYYLAFVHLEEDMAKSSFFLLA